MNAKQIIQHVGHIGGKSGLMNTKEASFHEYQRNSYQMKKELKGPALMNGHDRKISNMQLYIPVASIGSTTNTLDPSANLSGNLKIIQRMWIYRTNGTQAFNRTIQKQEKQWCTLLSTSTSHTRSERRKGKEQKKKHISFQAWIVSYLFKYTVGWRVSSFLLIPFRRKQKKKQNYYSI